MPGAAAAPGPHPSARRRRRLPLAIVLAAAVAFCVTTAAEERVHYVYLAGPEVFLADARQAGEDKKRIIEELNATYDWPFRLEGLYPLDNAIDDFGPNRETALRIYRANIDMMQRADAVAANMVRFRGPGMDGGTAFEMGYMRGLGKPVFAYYNAAPFYGEDEPPGLYAERVERHHGRHPTRTGVDIDGLAIETFGMADNLMMIGALDDTATTLQPTFREAVMEIAAFFEKRAR